MSALDQAEPRGLTPGQPLQLFERLVHHAALLLREDNALSQSTHHVQSLVTCACFLKHNQQDGYSQSDVHSSKDSGRNLVGERRPIQMLGEKKRSEHPRGHLTTAAAGA